MKPIFALFVYVFTCLPLTLAAQFEKINYKFSAEPIDVVIPCAPKDKKTLSLCIQGIKQYGNNIRRIIVVSKEKITDEAEWYSEDAYPFTKEDIAREIFHGDKKAYKKFLLRKRSRIGWIYQQFLKLYAPFVIPEISSNVLVLDSDVIFLNPTNFMTETGEPIFHPAPEYHAPYFDHMKKLLPDLKKVYEEHSGVSHHMLFQRPILEDLFNLISQQHKVDAWKAIARCINPKIENLISLSEYEIYFNFALLRSSQVHIETIKWLNVSPLKKLEKYKNLGFSFLACHEYNND